MTVGVDVVGKPPIKVGDVDGKAVLSTGVVGTTGDNVGTVVVPVDATGAEVGTTVGNVVDRPVGGIVATFGANGDVVGETVATFGADGDAVGETVLARDGERVGYDITPGKLGVREG